MPSPSSDREIYQIAGDPPVPPELAGGAPSDVRAAPTGVAYVFYQSPWAADPFILTVDVYALPGQPVKVHLLCPKCRKALNIDQTMKAMEWQPPRAEDLPPPGFTQPGGFLAVEAFQCTWELTDQKEFGGELCRWKVGITGARRGGQFMNVARSA